MIVETKELLEKLYELYVRNLEIYNKNGREPFEAGRLDGVNQCIELVKKAVGDKVGEST